MKKIGLYLKRETKELVVKKDAESQSKMVS